MRASIAQPSEPLKARARRHAEVSIQKGTQRTGLWVRELLAAAPLRKRLGERFRLTGRASGTYSF